jgi:hypothetical protein
MDDLSLYLTTLVLRTLLNFSLSLASHRLVLGLFFLSFLVRLVRLLA